MWERPQRRDGASPARTRGTKAPPIFSIAERLQLFAREFAAIFFRKRQAEVDRPSKLLQMRGRNQGVAAVVAFAREYNAGSGIWKKLLNGVRDTGAGLVHQRFNFDATRERGFFRGAHLGRAQNRRVHQPSGCVGADFFFFDFLLWLSSLSSVCRVDFFFFDVVVFSVSESDALSDDFLCFEDLLFELLLAERLERERSGSRTLV